MYQLTDCMICGAAGRKLYDGLIDSSLVVAGTFNFKVCPDCGLLWLDPAPDINEIPGFYKDYFGEEVKTSVNLEHPRRFLAGARDFLRESIIFGYYGYHHLARSKGSALLGAMLGLLPFLRSRANYIIPGYLPFKHPDPGALLVDVGCGRGNYLEKLRSLGWRVKGIEPDPAAAEMTKKKGIPVFRGTLQDAALETESADYITLMHVIEHIPDTSALLKECFRVLKKNGKLVIRTPNANSLGHKIFKRDFYALGTPRHLYLFTPKSLRLIFNKCGFTDVLIRTLADRAPSIYDNSLAIRSDGKIVDPCVKPRKGRGWFKWKESLFCGLGCECGEEIEAIITKSHAEKI